MASASEIVVEPLTSAVGALIHGVDMRQPPSAQTAAAIRQAILKHLSLIHI